MHLAVSFPAEAAAELDCFPLWWFHLALCNKRQQELLKDDKRKSCFLIYTQIYRPKAENSVNGKI